MDECSARALNELNKRFYERQAGAFSATRNNSWRGWQLALEAAGVASGGAAGSRDGASEGPSDRRLDVLDVACGNLRFEAWAREAVAGCELRFTALDACRGLLPESLPDNVRFEERDVVGLLLDGGALRIVPEGACFDLAVSFGFMHHIPGCAARAAFLDVLLGATRPGGHVVVSFWRFSDDAGLRERAEASTAGALAGGGIGPVALDEGDYLLGFGEESTDLRYCHSFSDEDVDAILDAVETPCELVSRFRADGRTNALNEYLVLRRRCDA